MNKMVFALVIIALAASASARAADQSAFLQCGVQLGSNYLTPKPKPESRTKKETRLSRVEGAVKPINTGLSLAEASAVSSFSGHADLSNSIEFRLQPKVTVASVGCSWQ